MNNSLRLTVITLLLSVSNLSAATLTVGAGGTYGTIQQAVDAAATGDLILVSDGTYSGGVTVNKPLLRLQSVNGPQFTVINGGGSARCVSLIYSNALIDANGSSLSGFTLTGGKVYDGNGGGVWCTATSVCLTNCTLSGNSVYAGNGGGAYGCMLYNCTLSGNTVAHTVDFSGDGGGAANCALYNCTLSGNMVGLATQDFNGGGGGAANCALYNCTLTGNSIINYLHGNGGGACNCALYNCTLTTNFVRTDLGGGAYNCGLYNCTLLGNYGGMSPGIGAAFACVLYNCILYYNSDYYGYSGDNYLNSSLSFCCTAPQPRTGVGNITNAPLWVDYTSGNLRLQSNSPCINAGNNAYVTTTTDLDGNPRIVGGTVDMGAYEYQGTGSLISYAWLQQYGLPTDGSADSADADADGMNNWQEWVCGTDPTNALSALRLLLATSTGTNVAVSWQSVAGVNYFLARSANLAAPFTLVATNIIGQAGTTTYRDTNASSAGPFFYRVGVNSP